MPVNHPYTQVKTWNMLFAWIDFPWTVSLPIFTSILPQFAFICGSIVQSFLPSLWCRAWLKLISKVDNWNNSIACIGETTGSAAKKLGLKSIYYPTTPGLEGYAHIMLPFEQHHPIVMHTSGMLNISNCCSHQILRSPWLLPNLYAWLVMLLFIGGLKAFLKRSESTGN